MKLKAYLKKKGMKPLDFARVINVSEMSIYRWMNGTNIPQTKTIESIDRATNGKVKPKDFYE